MNYSMLRPLLAASLLTSSLTVLADEPYNQAYVSVGANQFLFDDGHNLDDDADIYLGFGYFLNEHWSIDAEYTQLETTLDSNTSVGFEADFWSVNGIYRYQPRDMSSFFWKLGYGKYDQLPDTNDESAARLGAGYDFSLGENLSFDLGVDALAGLGKSNLDWVAYAGLNYYFGNASKSAPAVPAPAPKAPPAPLDSDKDGVYDNVDQCPTTPMNTPVDAKGCELDSDGDGVVDSKDKCADTPAGAKVDATGCRVYLTEDVSIALNVKFANNSNVVSDDYREEISKVANFMREYPDTNVVIEGHTDSIGSATYNQQLSQKRAEAVMQYIIQNFQIDTSRISAVGRGEEAPIASNDTASGRATNRRVQAEMKASRTVAQ